MQQFLETCEKAARAGGEVLLDWRDRFKVSKKGPGDLVTEADFEAQRVIQDILLEQFPDHLFVGEEDMEEGVEGCQAGQPSGVYQWIVDPLDGTTNYVHGFPAFGVSVALVRDSQPLVGVVYEPISGRCFRAVRDGGAFLNDAPIRTTSCERLSEALIGASLPAFVPPDSTDLRRFVEVVGGCQAIRRIGSAALNLCYVAAGWLDGYYGETVKSWDVAAGILLVREAGGHLTAMGGGPFRLENPNFVCAATSQLHAELSTRLSRAE